MYLCVFHRALEYMLDSYSVEARIQIRTKEAFTEGHMHLRKQPTGN